MTPASRKSSIFISYRRDDSAGYAGRLYDDVVEQIGEDRVFRDIDTIEPGQDFVTVLDETLNAVSVLLVVIGPQWVAITDANGRRRLENPDDFVRMEVGRALSRGVRVIPVLVEDARMPRAAELPEELQALTRRQYHELSDSRWEYDVGKLIETIEGPDRDTGRVNRRVIVATGAGAVLLVGASAVAWRLWPDDDPSEARTSALASPDSDPTPTADESSSASTAEAISGTAQTAPNVPLPAIADHLIPDSQTTAWDQLGQRTVRGVVYHRNLGTLVEVDGFFRDPATRALNDFGVGHESGQIWMWNDPTGMPHPGVSANRAPWANGPVTAPSGDAPQFIAVHGTDAVNRDLVSITVTGDFDEGLSDSCKRSVAWLTAHFADLAGIAWSDYPHVLEAGHMFIILHQEFFSEGPCPGQALTDSAAEIIELTRDMLRQYQTGI